MASSLLNKPLYTLVNDERNAVWSGACDKAKLRTGTYAIRLAEYNLNPTLSNLRRDMNMIERIMKYASSISRAVGKIGSCTSGCRYCAISSSERIDSVVKEEVANVGRLCLGCVKEGTYIARKSRCENHK